MATEGIWKIRTLLLAALFFAALALAYGSPFEDAAERESLLESGLDEGEDAKRAWSNRMMSWGKRDDDVDKRKWSNMQVWGKRSSDNEDEDRLKRGWKSMQVWGKRAGPFPFFGGPKRGWGSGSMSAWGKRSASD